MKTLYLFRHAKSSWGSAGISDVDRPLLEKGIIRTGRIIQYLETQRIKPDLIISSPAVRAFETARLVAGGLGYPSEKIVTDQRIYEGYYDRILDIIYSTDSEVNSLMIIGHNPTITNLANLFLHPGIKEMPTSAVVAISFNTHKWEEVPGAESGLLFLITPKNLK